MPRGLGKDVKTSLEKAKESALLAIEVYNKPAIKFRSGGFIVLMVIAWTSLFHAYFFKQKVKPYARKKGSKKFEKVDGDYWYWDLTTCLFEYFKGESQSATKKNLEFFIPLRNKIEHKSLPEIDADIFAECQALLLNFDKFLEKEFGQDHCIRESLSFALQLFPSSTTLTEAVKSNPSAKETVSFIQKYRSALSNDVLESGDYSFKAFLIQVANHQSLEALPVQFIKWDSLSDEEKTKVRRYTAMIRDKVVERPVVNQNLFLPGKVVQALQIGLGNPMVQDGRKSKPKINHETHKRLKAKYLELNGQPNPSFCVMDKISNNLVFTQAWIDLLLEKLKQTGEYETLYPNRKQS